MDLCEGVFILGTCLRFRIGPSKKYLAAYIAAYDKASYILFTGKSCRVASPCARSLFYAQTQIRMGMMM
jgi:hypothetical protein